MGGDNDKDITSPCAMDCKTPGHKHEETIETDLLGRPLPPVEERPPANRDQAVYLEEPAVVPSDSGQVITGPSAAQGQLTKKQVED